jgi:WhiB family transcriptional regulator, redox-sensing transcriptional regulator
VSNYTGATPDTEPARTWLKDAACRADGVDPDAFFPANTVDSIDRARAICTGCPVQRDCLIDCMRHEGGRAAASRFGVYAGLSPRQRAALYQRLREARKRKQQAT